MHLDKPYAIAIPPTVGPIGNVVTLLATATTMLKIKVIFWYGLTNEKGRRFRLLPVEQV